jgi:ribonuclease P protein component
MHRSADFAGALRAGRRARRGCLVVHQAVAVEPSHPGNVASSRGPLVGLIVSKSVGGSVVRHRVARQLRAQLAQRVDGLPADSRTVVRALPDSARATSVELGIDLDRALRTLAAAK